MPQRGPRSPRAGRAARALAGCAASARSAPFGLHRPQPRRRWAEWEDAVLRDGYTSALPCAEIARQLPERTATSVAARARKLGLISYARRWSTDDDQRLMRLTARGTALEEVAERLGRTPEAIRRRASRLAIEPPAPASAPRHARRWTRRRTSCCACTTRSTRAASPSCSDAQTAPSADTRARSGCAPAPSAPPTIRATDQSPGPARAAARTPAGASSQRRTRHSHAVQLRAQHAAGGSVRAWVRGVGEVRRRVHVGIHNRRPWRGTVAGPTGLRRAGCGLQD